MSMNDKSIDRLYKIFREKMHEVYRKNYKPDPFGNSMTTEYNAWQRYLRDSLSLEIEDVDPGDGPGFAWGRDKIRKVKILNPSNGAAFSHECILVPMDLAEKTLVLGSLPDELPRT